MYEIAFTDLARIGITILSFTLIDVNDDNGYYEAFATPLAGISQDFQTI